MVKFTIEQIRALMDYKDNIRNMSGMPCSYGDMFVVFVCCSRHLC